jgi:phosphate transport system permease protein
MKMNEAVERAVNAVPASKPRKVRRFTADISAVGEPWLWALGCALALGITLIVGFLLIIFWNGITTFWPNRIEVVTLSDGKRIAGEPTRPEKYRPGPEVLNKLTPALRSEIERNDGFARRTLYRIGNYELYNEDFRWASDFEATNVAKPKNFFFFERQEWGPFVGTIDRVFIDGTAKPATDYTLDQLYSLQKAARDRFLEIRRIERVEIGRVNHHMEGKRLKVRRAEIDYGTGDPQLAKIKDAVAADMAILKRRYDEFAATAATIKKRDETVQVVLKEVEGKEKQLPFSQIVRFYPSNDLGWIDRAAIYLSRWGEFLADEPREANTEGGILPAIFGTVTMTLLMVLVVAPFGVVTALYLREYAKQGRLVAIVRISVNNLAGVPSIVYGVFGVGFFAYTVGGGIDALFFPERLPAPTFGTGGILWSALTLALLTVPVVIVASEEALAAVPRSIREGSLACGASKWQTIKHVVLPHAMPGVMTGLILAMARGAGEVAPLMLVGVVKLAPELPVDEFFPFVHLERSFMHLGFHIFDVGFQSRNSEAGKPMVFVTTLLLLGVIVAMNSLAIYIRNRLKKQFVGSQF